MRHRPVLLLALGAALSAGSPVRLSAQHEGHEMPAPGAPHPLGISDNRSSSGTAWLPDAARMHAVHVTAGSWALMAHWYAFLFFDSQGGPRGNDQLALASWAMLAAARPAAGGRLELRAMASADPWTVSDGGYPLLLQSGETYRGARLRDRQHPHDLFVELAALYERRLAGGLALALYAGPVGEPALGPVAFPHRPSAAADPFAPLGHHWQDATHITYGVATVGVFTRVVKLEASVFNGREPDEERTNFDFSGRRLDSYAGRITVHPGARWAASAWYAYLESPEELEPDEPVHRFGAALLHDRPLGRGGDWSSILTWGANRHLGGPIDHSLLLETTVTLGRNALFGRLEYVRKTAADLAIGGADPDRRYDLGAIAAGVIREVASAGSFGVGLGARAAINVVPPSLEAAYGSRTPVGGAVYVRVRPR